MHRRWIIGDWVSFSSKWRMEPHPSMQRLKHAELERFWRASNSSGCPPISAAVWPISSWICWWTTNPSDWAGRKMESRASWTIGGLTGLIGRGSRNRASRRLSSRAYPRISRLLGRKKWQRQHLPLYRIGGLTLRILNCGKTHNGIRMAWCICTSLPVNYLYKIKCEDYCISGKRKGKTFGTTNLGHCYLPTES